MTQTIEQTVLYAIVKALEIYAVPLTARLEEPEDDTCDHGVVFTDVAGKDTDYEIQIGSDGCCLNRYGRDDAGEIDSVTLLVDWPFSLMARKSIREWSVDAVLRMMLETGRDTKSAGQLAYELHMIENPVFKHGVVFNQPWPIWNNLDLASRAAWEGSAKWPAEKRASHSRRRRGTAA